MINRAGETIGRAAESTREAAGEVTARLRQQMPESRMPYALAGAGLAVAWFALSRRRQLLNENPLLFGLLAAAAGALVGASFPATEMEDELMGDTRDRVLASARSIAEGRIQQFAQGG